MSWTWSLIKRSQGSLFYRLESTTHKNVRECTYCVQLYLCFNLQHKSNQIDVFVDSKRPQYYVQVYTGCNHQAFRSILGQNEEWLDPEHFSGFSRVFFRVKDVQWCSTYEIHWKLLEHLRFQHLSTSQGPWCAVQRTERKAEVPPRCDSDMRHETWAGPAFLSCCTMVLWWLELIRRRSECAQLILFQQPGCIWKSSGCIALQIWPSAVPCGGVVLTAKCTWKVAEDSWGVRVVQRARKEDTDCLKFSERCPCPRNTYSQFL